MLKQTITYTDFNDVAHTEDFYFNLSKRELAEMEVVSGGTYQAYLQKIIASEDNSEILKTFKEILTASYGVRSEDGALFTKSEDATKHFVGSGAMDALILSFFQDASLASDFVTGIIPSDLQGAAVQAVDGFRPGADTTPPTPPVTGGTTPTGPVSVPADPTPAAPVESVAVTDPTPVIPPAPVVANPSPVPPGLVDGTPAVVPDPPVAPPETVIPTPPTVQTELNDPTWPVDNVPVSTDPAEAVSIDPPATVDPSVVVTTDTISAPPVAADPNAPVPVTDPRLVTDLPTANPGADSVTPPPVAASGSPLFDQLSSDSGLTPADIEPDAPQQ